MKNRSVIWIIISLMFMVLWNVSLISDCKTKAQINHKMNVEMTLDVLRTQEIALERYHSFQEWGNKGKHSCYDYLCAYLITGETQKGRLEKLIDGFLQYRKEEFENLSEYLCAVWADLEYFPIPLSMVNEEAGVAFSNTWMAERTFGGERGHEGTDIMASINQRGRYPVVSMTSGVVEKIGWLPQGGYRLGIRAPHGAYFYYAHLYDYAKEFQPGEQIQAGELIGFMGDSGYSETEGTVGNFDVHLHLGIYVNALDGSEVSINPYYPLKYLELRKLQYAFY